VKDCIHLEKCPIFERFRIEAMKNVWIRLYCRGSKQEDCLRLIQMRRGEQPGPRLLPSGELLPE
jgi:hypothetical protein